MEAEAEAAKMDDTEGGEKRHINRREKEMEGRTEGDAKKRKEAQKTSTLRFWRGYLSRADKG